MSDPDSSCPFDLLDAAMLEPFLQQAFRQLDQRHLYGIIARVCRSWHHLSTTSSSSLTVEVSTRRNRATWELDAAISFSRWLQHYIHNLTRLDLTFDMSGYSYHGPEILQAIISATQLCSLRLDLSDNDRYLPKTFVGMSALTNLTSLALYSCRLEPPDVSSLLALTQLRVLDLRDVVLVNEEQQQQEQQRLMPELTSSLVNLTSLTLRKLSGWADLDDGLTDVEEGLACLRSLPKLVDLDIRDTTIPSGGLVPLVGELPLTGVKISLTDPGHIFKVAGWLERGVPTTLRCLGLYIQRDTQLSSSQVTHLLSPLRSAGPQLKELTLLGFDLSQADNVRIITDVTQLTCLDMKACRYDDESWALLEPGFPHLHVYWRDRARFNYRLSWFKVKVSPCS